MEFKTLLLVIILLAFDCSKCCEGIKPGNDVFLMKQDAKFVVGRKMLQLVDDDKTPHLSGVKKRADLPNSANENVVAKNDQRFVKESELSKAADEVANLMHRDYKEAGRRRSPIHNHSPNN